MSQKVENLSLRTVGHTMPDSSHAYADDNIFITMSVRDYGFSNLQQGQPYRITEGRVVLVTSGWVRVAVNLEEHVLHQQSVLVSYPGSIFEIREWSPDFNLQGFSFRTAPVLPHSAKGLPQEGYSTFVSHLSSQEWQLSQQYVQLIWQQVHMQPVLHEAITHLQTALLLELQSIAMRQEVQLLKTATRQELIFRQFLELVGKHGLRQRKIQFYADKLCLTPNHLGSVIRQASGKTVMHWLNRHAIQEAKILLRYTDLPICEIAEQINFSNTSFFSKFFKKETTLTPTEYRQEG